MATRTSDLIYILGAVAYAEQVAEESFIDAIRPSEDDQSARSLLSARA